jgi:hypothetical protein
MVHNNFEKKRMRVFRQNNEFVKYHGRMALKKRRLLPAGGAGIEKAASHQSCDLLFVINIA